MFDKDELISVFGLHNAKVSGDNLMASCPSGNHADKRPSFGINLYSGQWNCYSCDNFKGSTLISLAIALDVLLPKHLEIMTFEPKQTKEFALEDHLSKGRLVAHGFLKNRGVTYDSIIRFKVGANAENNDIYFPAFDTNGKFLGASIRNHTMPNRYRFYPDGVDRKNMLFGLDEPVDDLYLVEGPVDMLKLNGWGYRSAATCGNFVFQQQARKILDNCKRIILVPDIDDGGRKWYKMAKSKFFGRKRVFMRVVPKEFKDVGHPEMTKEIFDSLDEKFLY